MATAAYPVHRNGLGAAGRCDRGRLTLYLRGAGGGTADRRRRDRRLVQRAVIGLTDGGGTTAGRTTDTGGTGTPWPAGVKGGGGGVGELGLVGSIEVAVGGVSFEARWRMKKEGAKRARAVPSSKPGARRSSLAAS